MSGPIGGVIRPEAGFWAGALYGVPYTADDLRDDGRTKSAIDESHAENVLKEIVAYVQSRDFAWRKPPIPTDEPRFVVMLFDLQPAGYVAIRSDGTLCAVGDWGWFAFKVSYLPSQRYGCVIEYDRRSRVWVNGGRE